MAKIYYWRHDASDTVWVSTKWEADDMIGIDPTTKEIYCKIKRQEIEYEASTST